MKAILKEFEKDGFHYRIIRDTVQDKYYEDQIVSDTLNLQVKDYVLLCIPFWADIKIINIEVEEDVVDSYNMLEEILTKIVYPYGYGTV